jgi:hypothetical protein
LFEVEIDMIRHAFAALFLAALAVPAAAVGLPAETAVLVELDSIDGIAKSYQGSAARRIVDEVPPLRQAADAFLGNLGKGLEQKIEMFRRFLGFSTKDRDEILRLPSVLKGRATLAVVPVGGAEVQVVLRYEAASEKESDALRSAIAILEAAVLKVDPASRIELSDGMSIYRDGTDSAKLAYAFRGQTMVISPLPELVRDCLAAEGADPGATKIERAVAATGGGPGLRAWLHVGALARLGEKGAFDEGFRNLVRGLDAMGIRSAAWASGFTRGGGKDALHLSAPEDSLLVRAAKDGGAAPWPGEAPEGTLFSITFGSSPSGLLTTWLELVEKVDEQAFEKAVEGLDQLLVGLGLDAEDDLLGHLGEGVVVHFLPGKDDLEPIAWAPVENHAELLTNMDFIAETAQWRRTVREDGTLWIDARGQTAFLLRKDRFYIAKLPALALLRNAPKARRVDALKDRRPEGARMLLVADHEALLAPIREALAQKAPGLARVLAPGGKLESVLGGEILSLSPARGGVTLVHESTAAPAGTWLAAAALLGIAKDLPAAEE